jgi:hypothetical protein
LLAPSQRRRFPYYYSLPLVVAILLLVVAKLVALERADIVAQLSDRIAHGDSPEAAAAVRQLAAMPRAPISVLVSAAASADREVAEEGKHCIGRLLRREQRQIEAGRRVGQVARQLADLAEALDAHQAAFSQSDYRWLSGTTRKVLRLANRIPSKHTPLVAVHCDVILAMIASAESADTDIARKATEVEKASLSTGAMVDGGASTRQARMQSEIATTPTSPPQAMASEHFDAPTQASTQRNDDVAVEVSAEELISPWQASWAHPLFRIVPARPISPPPAEEDATPMTPLPSTPAGEMPSVEPNTIDSPMAGNDSRSLLRQWLNADGSARLLLVEELTRRGFGRLSERHVEQLFSTNLEDRLALADNVLTEPGVDARPWLVLLSEDEAADVRLLAVTIMATSNDPVLVEKAWQVSIRDRDSRIAGMAGRLRERRESAQR